MQVFNAAGEYISHFGSHGSEDGQLSHPRALAVDSEDDVWVLDNSNRRLVEFDNTGEFVRNVDLPGRGSAIAIDGKDKVWVSIAESGLPSRQAASSRAPERRGASPAVPVPR